MTTVTVPETLAVTDAVRRPGDGMPDVAGPRTQHVADWPGSEPRLRIMPSSRHGVGLFAEDPIEAHTVLERSPVLLVPETQWSALRRTTIHDYCFSWPDGSAAVVLGPGSLINHSYRANTRVDIDLRRNLMVFTSIEPIPSGEEITINYNGEPNCTRSVWCDWNPKSDPQRSTDHERS